MTEIILPKLGMDMQTGTIMTWFKKEGDVVTKGEPLFEMMTDKVNMEVEAEADGVLLKRYYGTGIELPVFTAIGCIGKAGERVVEKERVIPVANMKEPGHLSNTDRAALRMARTGVVGGEEKHPQVRATPSARRLAAENGIALENVTGTGPKGRIQIEDVEGIVEKMAEQKKETPVSNPGLSGDLDAKISDILAETGMEDLEAELGADLKVEDEAPVKEPTASPLAARIAEVEGIAIASVGRGSGSGGRVMKADVIDYMNRPEGCECREEEPSEAPKAVAEKVAEAVKEPATEAILEPANGTKKTLPLTPKRKIIAKHMVKSHQENAVITLTTEVDMTEVKELRKRIAKKIEDERGARCTYTDFLLASVSRALVEHPVLNGSFAEDHIVMHEAVSIGLAVGQDDGLVVPVIKNCDRLSFPEMVQARNETLKALKQKTLTPDCFKDSTFTVTNLGMYGILEFTAIINQPNSAILSVGEINERIRVYKGEAVPRYVMRMSLNLDHRIADGLSGAKFLQTVRSYLENPALLLF